MLAARWVPSWPALPLSFTETQMLWPHSFWCSLWNWNSSVLKVSTGTFWVPPPAALWSGPLLTLSFSRCGACCLSGAWEWEFEWEWHFYFWVWKILSCFLQSDLTENSNVQIWWDRNGLIGRWQQAQSYDMCRCRQHSSLPETTYFTQLPCCSCVKVLFSPSLELWEFFF